MLGRKRTYEEEETSPNNVGRIKYKMENVYLGTLITVPNTILNLNLCKIFKLESQIYALIAISKHNHPMVLTFLQNP